MQEGVDDHAKYEAVYKNLQHVAKELHPENAACSCSYRRHNLRLSTVFIFVSNSIYLQFRTSIQGKEHESNVEGAELRAWI